MALSVTNVKDNASVPLSAALTFLPDQLVFDLKFCGNPDRNDCRGRGRVETRHRSRNDDQRRIWSWPAPRSLHPAIPAMA